MSKILIVNCKTGEQEVRNMTSAEEARLRAVRAEDARRVKKEKEKAERLERNLDRMAKGERLSKDELRELLGGRA